MAFQVVIQGPLFTTDAGPEVKTALEVTVRDLAEKGLEHLQQTVQVKSGGYRAQLAMNIEGPMARLHDNNAIIGPFLEFGTRAHTIAPRTKDALYWPGAEHPVKIVRHPGTKGYAAFRQTADWLDAQAGELCDKHGAELAQKLGGA